MQNTRKIACVLAVFVLAISVAAVAVSVPSVSARSVNSLDKLESKLKNELPALLKASPNEELKTLVFLTHGANVASAKSLIASNGALVDDQYQTIGAISASIPAKSLLRVASSDQVEKIYLDEKKQAIPVPQGDFANDFATIFNPTTGIWSASTPYTMGVNKVWQKGISGKGVVVAVLDTGADVTQRDLAPAIYATKSFTSDPFHDVDGHGTSTAGLVASRAVNTYFGFIKIQGMAPNATIMAGKVLGDDGYGFDSWIIAGIEWAVDGPDGNPSTSDGAQIISMSLGGLEVPNDGNDPTALALDRAAEMGVTSFVAAGNEGMGSGTIGSPGVSESTITVGASTNNAEAMYLLGYWPFTKWNGQYYSRDYQNNHMIWWSSKGPTADGRIDPDIAAVGAWGPAITPGNAADPQFGGTSMATPVAAGIGALVIEAYKNAHDGTAPTPSQMKEILMGTAMDIGYGPLDQGAGRVDALKAYEAAIGTREYSDKTSLALTIEAGRSQTVNLGTDKISSKTFELIPNSGFVVSGQVHINKDFFYPFQIPQGVSYATFDLTFDPILTFGTSVQQFTGPGYTDDHVNIILYKIENGQRVMINYAYAHANNQDMNVRVTPGSYEFRVWGAQNVNKFIPFTVKSEYYKTTAWSWVTVNGQTATIKVPSFATAGTYAAFLLATVGETTSLVPVAVTVPMTVGKLVKGAIDVTHDSASSMTGDTVYYTIGVPQGSEALTATLVWTDMNTDIDLYLIDPAGDIMAQSLTPYLGEGLFGPWTTSTGTTAQVLSVPQPASGMWMIGLHDTFLGKVFAEPYMLMATLTSPVTFDESALTVSGSAQVFVANGLPLPMKVGLAAVKNDLAATTTYFNGVVKSKDLGGQAFDEHVFEIAPGTESMKLSISWGVPGSDVTVVLYDSSSNRGILVANGADLVIANPEPGLWDAIVMLGSTGQETAYTLTLETMSHPAWTDLTVSPSMLQLGPLDAEPVMLTASSSPVTTTGMVVLYDSVTGAIYDTLSVTLS